MASLTLSNTAWERVNVEAVITRNADCDNRGDGFISSRSFVMNKKQRQRIDAPNGASICWRRDRYPDNPMPGAWSGWSRAVLFPGASIESEI